MPKVAPKLLMFQPQQWGQIDRFKNLYTKTYSFSERDKRALVGVSAHFDKFRRLRNLAERLKSNIQEDNAQLDAHGYTNAENAKDVAALIEASVVELYAAVDCTIQVLRAIYKKDTAGFKDSTRKTFQDVNRLSGSFPNHLKAVISEAAWFNRLLHLRDNLTHLDTGSTRLNPETNLVSYNHYGMKEFGEPLIIDDVFGWLERIDSDINAFLGSTFHHLNSTLIDEPVFQMCGMVDGRVLHRFVSPVDDLTFDSGHCGAWVWFEEPDMPNCPFSQNCGAYLRKADPAG